MAKPNNHEDRPVRQRANPWYVLILVLNPVTVLGVGMWVQAKVSNVEMNAAMVVELKKSTEALTAATTALTEASKLAQQKLSDLDKSTDQLKTAMTKQAEATAELSKSTAVMQEQMSTLRRDTDSMLRKLEKTP